MRGVFAARAVAVVMLASGCTVAFPHPGTSVACTPLRFAVNSHDVSVGAPQRQAIVDAVEDFGVLVGRSVEFLGDTDDTASSHRAGDPLLIELVWPDDAPVSLGFAAPAIEGDNYIEGWMYLNPVIRSAPTGVVRRLVLHELGHLSGSAMWPTRQS